MGRPRSQTGHGGSATSHRMLQSPLQVPDSHTRPRSACHQAWTPQITDIRSTAHWSASSAQCPHPHTSLILCCPHPTWFMPLNRPGSPPALFKILFFLPTSHWSLSHCLPLSVAALDFEQNHRNTFYRHFEAFPRLTPDKRAGEGGSLTLAPGLTPGSFLTLFRPKYGSYILSMMPVRVFIERARKNGGSWIQPRARKAKA